MRPIKIPLVLCGVLLLAGCAFENKSLLRYDGASGYRLPNLHTDSLNSDEVFVVLAFSGGVARAAAFSYGAMKQLAATPITYGGTKRRLLDEVDIISSVSGGSFTSAYYALYGDRLFADFERDFLNKNVELGLALRVLNPLNWPRLASPYFDRIDLAAEYLTISAGGALGGLLVAFVAPHVFNGFYEFPLALMACAALTLLALRASPDPQWFRQFLPPLRTVAAFVVVGLTGYLGYASRDRVIGWAEDLAHWAAPKWTPPDELRRSTPSRWPS